MFIENICSIEAFIYNYCKKILCNILCYEIVSKDTGYFGNGSKYVHAQLSPNIKKL